MRHFKIPQEGEDLLQKKRLRRSCKQENSPSLLKKPTVNAGCASQRVMWSVESSKVHLPPPPPSAPPESSDSPYLR
uniref:Uncharacterized protein n=1 Tax=Gasterosteus aculeatus TaxID=69293 RepID=G3PL57_GASAC